MFSRIRMINGWFTGSVVSNLELEAIDAMRPKAIDGDGGGTYAPTATLTIGGLATTLSATTLTLSATAMAVSAPGTWTAVQTFNAAVTYGASGTLTTNASQTSTFAGVTKHTGRTVRRARVDLSAATQTVGPTDGNHFKLASPGASSYTINLRETGPAPEEGDWMRFFMPAGASGAGGYIFRNATSLNEVCGLSGTHADITGAFPSFVEVEFKGGTWVFADGALGSVVLP